MKKILLGFLCLLILISCDISLPHINIRGTPGVYIFLGSPFENMDSIESYISPESIMGMMGEGVQVKIYDYMPSSDIQAYVLHYPIADTKLEFGELLNDIFASEDVKFDIPSAFGNIQGSFNNGICLEKQILNLNASALTAYILEQTAPSHNPLSCTCAPFVSVNLEEMAKLLYEAEGSLFGIEIDYDDDLATRLRLKIPAFGVDNYMYGTDVTVAGVRKLRFFNPDKTVFTPASGVANKDLREGKLLDIYVNITGQCEGEIIPGILFEWTKASIDTSSLGTFNDSFQIDFSELTTFFGGIEFSDVKGFVFVNGVGDHATMSLSLGSTPLQLVGGQAVTGLGLNEEERPDFDGLENMDPFTEVIDYHSLGDDPINFTAIFNNSNPGDLLNYDVDISRFEVMYADVMDTGSSITVDLVILFTLKFKVVTPVDNAQFCKKDDYVKLNMGLEDMFSGDNDLFGRTDSSDDDIFNFIEWVKIKIIDSTTDIFGSGELAILVTNNNPEEPYADYINFTDKRELEIRPADLPDIFIPRFEIMLKKDNASMDHAYLQVNRLEPGAPGFDFTLAVEAQADINITF